MLVFASPLMGAPRDYLPDPPSFDKKVADYTVQDVVGCAFTCRALLPNGHPFKPANGFAKIKSDWPGAKLPANIDVILTYVFPTTDSFDERSITNGIYWTIHEIMDVPATEKATAFVRVYDAQTDSVKKRKLAFMNQKLFPYLADERMLLPLKDMLDDSSVYRTERTEGGGVATTSVRRAAKGMFRRILFDKDLLSMDTDEGKYLMGEADIEAIFGGTATEEVSCGLLKTWITDHWQEIASQAAKARAKADREYEPPSNISSRSPR